MTDANQESEAQRLKSLREARQRIVELQAVRTYLLESSRPQPLLADLEAKLAQTLALEQSLIDQAGSRPLRLRRRGGKSPLLAALMLLGALADDSVVGALEFAFGL